MSVLVVLGELFLRFSFAPVSNVLLFPLTYCHSQNERMPGIKIYLFSSQSVFSRCNNKDPLNEPTP